MGKIQELHAVLDSGVVESEIPAAIRVASAETLRVANIDVKVTVHEALDIARLLIRLSLAAPSLKVGIVAGRVYGELLARCQDRVPELANFYFDFGKSVVCLLEASADGGAVVWHTASLAFAYTEHSQTGIGAVPSTNSGAFIIVAASKSFIRTYLLNSSFVL